MSEWPPALVEQVLDEMYGKALKDGAVVFEDRPSCDPGNDDEDFPVVCGNGCPEGHLGHHKFSCPLAAHDHGPENNCQACYYQEESQWSETFPEAPGE